MDDPRMPFPRMMAVRLYEGGDVPLDEAPAKLRVAATIGPGPITWNMSAQAARDLARRLERLAELEATGPAVVVVERAPAVDPLRISAYFVLSIVIGALDPLAWLWGLVHG